MTTPRRRTVGVVLVAAGLLLWVVALFADPLGVGGVPGFNWKQVVLAELGVASVAAGVLCSPGARGQGGA